LVSTNFCFLLPCRPFFNMFSSFPTFSTATCRLCWSTFQWNYEIQIVNSQSMPSQSLRSTRALMHSYTVEHCHLNSNGRLYLRCMWKLVQQCFQIDFARAWPLSPQPRSILFGSVVTPRHELLQPHCFFIGICHANFFLINESYMWALFLLVIILVMVILPQMNHISGDLCLQW
jgi:hypothetical protein